MTAGKTNEARLSRKRLRERFAARVEELGLPTYAHDPRYDRELARARRAKVAPDDLARLTRCPDEAVRLAVLTHPLTPSRALWHALRTPDYGPRSVVLQLVALHPNSTGATLDAVIATGEEPASSLATERLVDRRLRVVRSQLDLWAALALGAGLITVLVAIFAESVVAGQVAYFTLAGSCFLYWTEQGVGRGADDWQGFALKSALLVPLGGVLLWLGFTPDYGIPVLDALGRFLWLILDAL